MKNETIITVRDLIDIYSGDLIYIRDESCHKLYYGTVYFCDLRLKLCSVSKFRFTRIDERFALLITIKELK